MKQPLRLLGFVALALGFAAACALADPARVKLPPGFHIEVYAEVPGARSMAVAEPLGAVFVGTRGGRVFAVLDRDGDRTADAVVTVLSGQHVANGIAWRDGVLYVAEQHRVTRHAAPSIEAIGKGPPRVLFDRLPDKGWHGWRYAAIGPDGMLYVSVGAPCNVCSVQGLEGTILRLDAAGGRPEVFARGVRNSVGMDFQPATGELYFTDNGADNMGEDVRPDELNHAPRPGLHFGFPYYGGGDAATAFLKGGGPSVPVRMPVVRFPAHVAALGIHFYRGSMLPDEYRGDALVAHHGSWNRTIPDGYRIARVRFDAEGRATGWEPFAEGWLQDGAAWGRPVDVAELGDGSILVSDDRAGVLYRITYER
ncbi:MAG: PQQ-dependent sugar dehydrogenase [Rhodospirillales bacterium]|jgi:glucose/arabinose dehydrogenase|nr:PQQ-dependent sugar dehydrogenase [Rhodospirillales bacterium]MDP6882777.1 PQQ-dependent sugar dehydrogenase [Rhodospirillales bacterium]